jgi:Skp family chaperone for outer membrane proteins
MKCVTLFVAAVFIAMMSIGCEDNVTNRDIERQEKVVESAKDQVQEEKRQLDALNERQAVESQMERDLKELDAKIDSLEERASQAEAERKEELQRDVATLRQEYDEAQKKLDELKAASGDIWASAKLAAEKMWTDLRESVRSTTERWDKM